VPVTAKLSRRFYEVFGDEIANELVNWFNAVDATYRADLRELNELNFARFDAKVEQRFAESDAKWEWRFAESDAKWERRFAESDTKWEQRFAQLEAKVDRGFAEQRAHLLRWMFVYWGGSVVTTVGLVLLVLNTVR
jgi:beta-galactosidase GanA